MAHIHGLHDLLLKSTLIRDLDQLEGNSMSITYVVPAADIIAEWEKQKVQYLRELHEAQETAKDLKEKGVEDSCVNGKIEGCRRNIAVLTLQLKYIDRTNDVYMQDHEMYGLFGSHSDLGPNNPMAGQTERQY